jgi:U3 small nucleolar RNA-associated protein 18
MVRSFLLTFFSYHISIRWDIRTKKCVDRFHNEDGTITSFISASSRFLAVGAESGVVNIYNDNCNPFQKRSPLKSIMNMHTSIDFMRFNPTGDILALSSRREKDSLKLVHMPTQTVFSNWPTSKTPLGYVWSIDFSPGSKFMAVGNDKGKCLLYKLLHYSE